MTNSCLTVCGFIGLGSQGAPIAKRIIDAGYPVVLWARREQSLEPFRETPAIVAPNIRALAAKVDHVGVCVTDDSAVRSVCDELIAALRPGACLAIHSTTLPDTCREIARQAALHDLLFVEAPVSGGAPAAANGTLTVMAGGHPDAVALARPIFATFADNIMHLGDVGCGQIAKLINNTLMAANLGMVHSAVSAGQTLGIDVRALLDLLNSSSARSYASQVYARQPSMSAFPNAEALLDKVRLLGEVIADQNPAFTVLHNAAAAMHHSQG